MKTPQEMAEEWANGESDLWFADISTYTDGHKSAVKQAFLAGYQAARPQWISVEDRLPAINEWVIGYYSMWYESDKQWLGPVRRYEHPRRKATQWFIADANNEGENEEAKSVSHWMPLPKPPKEI